MSVGESGSQPGLQGPSERRQDPLPAAVSIPGAGKRLLGASLGVATLLIATKGVAFLRDPLVAALYGASPVSDSFYVAIGIVNLVYGVMLGGLVASVVPVFLSRRLNEGDRSAWEFLVSFIFWLIVGFAVIALVMFTFASRTVGLFAPGLSDESRRLAAGMLKILALVPMLTAVTTTLSSALNCYNRFLVPASMPLLGSIVSIVLLLALTPIIGVDGAAIAVAAGVVVQCLTIVAVSVHHVRHIAPSFRVADHGLGTALRLAGPGVLAEALLNCMSFMILFFATSLGAGVFSSIQYGNKLQVVFLDVFIAAISVVMYPQLAAAAVREDMESLRRLTGLNLRLMVLVLLPIVLAVVILRVPLTQLVYQRRAFDATATAQTAAALGLLALSLVPHAVKDASVRAFYSLRDTTTPVRALAVAVVADLILSLIMVDRLGGKGLVLAYSLSVALLAAILLVKLHNRGVLLLDNPLKSSLGRIGAAGAAMGVWLLIAQWVIGNRHHAYWQTVLEVAGSLCGGLFIYLMGIWWSGDAATREDLASHLLSGLRGRQGKRG